jgi:hypothetical protein
MTTLIKNEFKKIKGNIIHRRFRKEKKFTAKTFSKKINRNCIAVQTQILLDTNLHIRPNNIKITKWKVLSSTISLAIGTIETIPTLEETRSQLVIHPLYQLLKQHQSNPNQASKKKTTNMIPPPIKTEVLLSMMLRTDLWLCKKIKKNWRKSFAPMKPKLDSTSIEHEFLDYLHLS